MKTKVFMRKDEENFRLPVVLPSDHHVVKSLIMWKHQDLGHAGVQYLMSALREDYWILKSRKTIKKIIKTCTVCKRYNAKPVNVSAGFLPEDRIREAFVFEVIGVDLCGPLYLRNGSKSWAVLFTCAVYRAVHIELVTSLSTDSFILALRRFISRRGRPSVIYSDNGTNLVGTANELKSIDWSKLQELTSFKRITWKFNPPSAPWWGGFWERLIGMLKNILRRVLGNARLDYEDLYTVLCDAENVMNNRPLTYISENSNDLIPLTPMMFLQEIKESGVPDLDLIDSKKANKRYAYRQRIRQQLRKRFRIEYLGQLREYNKTVKEYNLEEGDIVLLGDDNVKRNNWCLAKVIKMYPGKDGKVRVAEVKTKHGTYLRPVQKLYPLELKDNDKLLKKNNPDVVTSDCSSTPSANPSRDPEPLNNNEVVTQISRFGRPLKKIQRMNL